MDGNSLIKTIVCLAASRKPGGRCIAGKDVSDKSTWVRPVSGGEEDAITNQQSCYSNGQSAQLLDIIEIPVLKPYPTQHQKENFLVDSRKKWTKKGIFDHNDLNTLLDNPSQLWQDLDSSYNGKNDRIPAGRADEINKSLFFIQVKCKILVKIEGKDFNNPHKKIRCSFKYQNTKYILSVTDPVTEQKYLSKTEGEYDVGEKYLCVSLGLEYEGYLYLFVAAIL
jgi:hypothetical protein